MTTEILGIDIGGSGIKGAPVNINTGELIAERHRIITPQPSLPGAVAEVVAEMLQHFNWQGPIGCTFPAVIKNGVVYTAANVDHSWIGTNGEALIQNKTGCPTLLLNDADAAGIAEMTYGAGKGHQGVVIMHTFGTGIGSAIFVNGQLVPNTEFGHLEIRCKEAEHRASARNRTDEDLNWKAWTWRVNEFLARMEALFWPDLFIIGGGVSRKNDKFLHLLQARAEIVPAQMLNQAGIIGAAIAAGKQFQSTEALE
ncbi:MAG: ROK family protein [Gammaproteobacteria bacterium]|nr:MAG: ROK family protein [Gammaproteobacteria bacterium]RKZ44583.1 MAG: ROK family protein [Gammaproteobacteria bacterium]RKZ76790.1 MAG: ROK family protein [Gammaproteobacteria bacterium]